MQVSQLDEVSLLKLAAVAEAQPHRAFRVWKRLTKALMEVVEGKRDVETAFNDIQIRDCLPQHTILATTWSIDDILEYFPYGTSNDEMYEKLQELEKNLNEVAVCYGHEVISDTFGRQADNHVVVQEVWAVKDLEAGYGDIYLHEQDAIEAHGAENIFKGYSLSGGPAISSFLAEHFRSFYESKQELLKEIEMHDGLVHLVKNWRMS